MEFNSWELHSILSWRDIVMVPIWLTILYFICLTIRKKRTRNSTERNYFIWAWNVRVIGTCLSAGLYEFYYHGGDTFGYFEGTGVIYRAFFEDIEMFFHLIFNQYINYSVEAKNLVRLTTEHAEFYYTAESSRLVIAIGGLLSIFTINSYLSIGLIISFFSFLGCWKLYRVFSELFPVNSKGLAMACLFIPSVFFWGAAGLMKDTICMASIGYLFEGTYLLFICRKKILSSIIKICFSTYLLIQIKIYIAIAFFPALLLWIFFSYNENIKNKTLRLLMKPIFFLLIFFSSILAFSTISSYSDRFGSIEKIIITAEVVQNAILETGGSSYNLGNWEPTISGISSMIPKSINVTLFRPYIWEVTQPILFISFIESFITLMITIFVLFKTGFIRSIKLISKEPCLIFCLMFSMGFSFAVGFSTFNFGALARYKIIGLPFYFSMLTILYNFSLAKNQ